MGAIVSTIFLGFGFYRIFTGAKRCEFILTSGGLYAGDPANKNISFQSLTLLNVYGGKISAGGRQIKIKFDNGSYIALDYKDCGLDKNRVLQMLGGAVG